MEIYFAIKDSKMVITKYAFKAQNGIGNHTIHKFDIPVEKEYSHNRHLLKLLVAAFETDSIIERNLYLSNFIIHISDFNNEDFTNYITQLWMTSVKSLASCLFAEKQTYGEVEAVKVSRKNLKKFFDKRKATYKM